MNTPVQHLEPPCKTVELLELYQAKYHELMALWLEHQERTVGLLEEFDATKDLLAIERRKSAEWMQISQSERAIVSTLRERNEALEQALKLAHRAIAKHVPQEERNPLLRQLSGYLR